MADIKSEFLSKYGIDLAQDNFLKWYKVDSPNIANDELEKRIQATRKRWNTSINGANERNAERDRKRLEKADVYEAILRDEALRKKVFDFYNQSGENTNSENGKGTVSSSVDFAKEYFSLVATTKKIKKSDVDFFFEYYRSERKNKKAIYDMLAKNMKVKGLIKGKNDDVDDNDEFDEIKEGKKKNNASPLITNLFQEATIKHIKRAIDNYEMAVKSDEICMRFPDIRESLYSFIGVKDVKTSQEFSDLISAKAKEMYAIRQEKGTEYVSVVDLFNELQAIKDNRDVVDNISEVKLLLKYPTLTPYMFAFVDMKPKTMEGIYDVASRNYSFRNQSDFILSYYNPISDNFGIINDGISGIIRKAKKDALKNGVLNKIDEKLGRDKNRWNIPVWAEIIHWLVYWPIFVFYFVFEVFKVILTNIHRLVIPVGIVVFILNNVLFPLKFKIENMLVLRKIIFKNEWLSYLSETIGGSMDNQIEIILLSLIQIILLLAIYVLPAICVGTFVKEFSESLNKSYDWIGLERTFGAIFDYLKKKTEDQFNSQKDTFVKGKIGKIIINISCLLMIIATVFFARFGIKSLAEVIDTKSFTEKTSDDIQDTTEESTMIITVGSANIRSGPGKEYEIVGKASQGDVFVSTGNEEVSSDGKIWYEVCMDSEKTQTGWASETVIDYQ